MVFSQISFLLFSIFFLSLSTSDIYTGYNVASFNEIFKDDAHATDEVIGGASADITRKERIYNLMMDNLCFTGTPEAGVDPCPQNVTDLVVHAWCDSTFVTNRGYVAGTVEIKFYESVDTYFSNATHNPANVVKYQIFHNDDYSPGITPMCSGVWKTKVDPAYYGTDYGDYGDAMKFSPDLNYEWYFKRRTFVDQSYYYNLAWEQDDIETISFRVVFNPPACGMDNTVAGTDNNCMCADYRNSHECECFGTNCNGPTIFNKFYASESKLVGIGKSVSAHQKLLRMEDDSLVYTGSKSISGPGMGQDAPTLVTNLLVKTHCMSNKDLPFSHGTIKMLFYESTTKNFADATLNPNNIVEYNMNNDNPPYCNNHILVDTPTELYGMASKFIYDDGNTLLSFLDNRYIFLVLDIIISVHDTYWYFPGNGGAYHKYAYYADYQNFDYQNPPNGNQFTIGETRPFKFEVTLNSIDCGGDSRIAGTGICYCPDYQAANPCECLDVCDPLCVAENPCLCDPCGCDGCSNECKEVSICYCNETQADSPCECLGVCDPLCVAEDPCLCDPCGCDVCSNECKEIDICLCNVKAPGCQIWCWDAYNWDPRVCSGHGTCKSINNCQCDTNYYGNRCQHFKCNYIDHLNPSTFDGFGKCVDHNSCVCDSGYSSIIPGRCDGCDLTRCSGVGTCVVNGYDNFTCSNCGIDISGDTCNRCIVNGKTGVQMDGICYVSYPDVKRDWQGARSYCKSAFHPASDLGVLKDSRAQKAFYEASGKRNSWILFSDGASKDNWEWKDGVTAPAYTNWNPGNPDDGGDCAYVHYHSGLWMNYFCYDRVSMNAITCAIEMSEVPFTFSSNPLLNIGYTKYDFSQGYCDWTVATNCPDEYQMCNSIKQGTPEVCNCNGTCLYDPSKKKNYCSCNDGWEGVDCEIEDVPIGGLECDGIGDYCYHMFHIKLTWNEAREHCKSIWLPSADLAIVFNQDAQEKIASIVGTNTAWIGALDFLEGSTHWVDNSPLSYSNFIVQNDGGLYGEDCVEMKSSYWMYKSRWSTSNCAVKKMFVCGVKFSEILQPESSSPWINVHYQYLNTLSATCNCDPSSTCCATECGGVITGC